MSHQLDLFEYVDKQEKILSLNEQIKSLVVGQEISIATISIRRTERFFEILQDGIFHECFREIEKCVQFIQEDVGFDNIF